MDIIEVKPNLRLKEQTHRHKKRRTLTRSVRLNLIYYCQLLEVEIILSIVVADILYHLIHALSLVANVWNLAVLDIVADKVTKNTTEVLMTWVRKE